MEFKQKLAFVGAVAVLALWWLMLFGLGYPKPHFDDIFFVGPAINLAEGRGLANPFIKTWAAQFQTDRFFLQPPFHSYLVSGWIKLFGLSANSLCAFVITCCFGTGLCLIQLGRRAGLGWISVMAVSVLASTWSLRSGMRPDAAGLFACGLAALGWTGRSRAAWFCGSFFGAVAPVIHPFTAAIVLPVGGWCLLTNLCDQPATVVRKEIAVRFGVALLAAALVFLLFLVAIEGRLTEFVQVFQHHASLRTTGMGQQWHVLWQKMSVGSEVFLRWPALVVLVVGLILAASKPSSRQAALSVAAVFLWHLVLGTLLYTGYVIQGLYLFALVAAALVGSRLSGRLSFGFGLGWANAAFLMVFPAVLSPFLSHSVDLDAAQIRHRVAALQAAPGRRILLDEYAARYVFDWKLPAGSEDWLHCHWAPSVPAPVRLAHKPASDVWLVDAQKLEAYIPDSGVTCQRIKLFGHTTSLLRYTGDLRVVP
jgi:hypothetical protein